MPATDNYADFIEGFRETIQTATARLKLIPEAQCRNRKSAEGWAPIEIVGHLIDSAANNHQRFVRAQFTDDLVFLGYEQEHWVSAQRYIDESWPEVVQLWSSYNLHLAHAASMIATDILTRQRTRHTLDQIAFKTVASSEATTLEYLIRDYVDHLRHHLDQILK